MPLYDFNCLSCQKKFELSLKLEELNINHNQPNSPTKICPFCSSKEIEKLITFKGAVLNSSSKSSSINSCQERENCHANGNGNESCGFGRGKWVWSELIFKSAQLYS